MENGCGSGRRSSSLFGVDGRVRGRWSRSGSMVAFEVDGRVRGRTVGVGDPSDPPPYPPPLGGEDQGKGSRSISG